MLLFCYVCFLLTYLYEMYTTSCFDVSSIFWFILFWKLIVIMCNSHDLMKRNKGIALLTLASFTRGQVHVVTAIS